MVSPEPDNIKIIKKFASFMKLKYYLKNVIGLV